MQNFWKMIVLSTLMLMLSACAFVSESVPLKPQVNVQPTLSGDGKIIALNIIDARPDSALGGRVTAYGPAAKISLENDLISVVRLEVTKGLAKNGFKVVPYTDNATRKLVVRIIALQYQQRTGFWAGTVIVTSTLEGSANNKGQTYENTYRTEDEHTVVFTPSADTDIKNINSGLASSLSKLLNDQSLMHFLAR